VSTFFVTAQLDHDDGERATRRARAAIFARSCGAAIEG
jgi:hypothetical protein